MLIRVTPERLDPEAAIEAVRRDEAGAVDLFLGVVRNENRGRAVDHLVYDAYPTMAEKTMRELAEAAAERFGLSGVAVLHRTGQLAIGETSLLVAVSAAHREATFEAGRWLVNEVKRRVPVWKKEVWADGEEWIEGPESLGMERASASPRGS